MDFSSRFPEIFSRKNSGFDALVGNPPYGAAITGKARTYLEGQHPLVADRETSQYFLSRSYSLVRDGGYVSMIVPNTIVLNIYAKKFRTELLSRFRLVDLIDLSGVDVFSGATVRTVIPVLKKERPEVKSQVRFVRIGPNLSVEQSILVSATKLGSQDDLWRTATQNELPAFVLRIKRSSLALGEILEISQGLIPYDKYRGHSPKTIKNRIWHADRKKNATFKKELQGEDVSRYHVRWNGRQWISYGEWLAAPRKPVFFKEPRLLFREITDPRSGLLHVGYTEEELYNNPSIINGIARGKPYSLFYLLGVCNSKLMGYLHFATSPKAQKGVFPKILVADVRALPIRPVEKGDKKVKSLHDQIAKLAGSMLDAITSLKDALSDRDRNYYESRCADLDRRINTLVYELYGLSKQEIEIVEAPVKRPNSVSTVRTAVGEIRLN